jgi:hypothetical protein
VKQLLLFGFVVTLPSRICEADAGVFVAEFQDIEFRYRLPVVLLETHVDVQMHAGETEYST